jgi:hypothetical protein
VTGFALVRPYWDCFCIAGSGALVLLCVVHFVWLLDLSLLVFSR